MDKLKPILTHKFWILAGVALLLPIIGWYMGTGKVAAEIDTRIAAINGLSVPPGNQIPNDDWMTKAKVVQDERQQRLDTAADYLWQAQQEYMTWPPNLRAYVADAKFLDDLGVDAEQRYRSSYDVERENLLKIVDPLRWNEKTMKEEGRVAVDPTALATLPLDASIWANSPPTSKEVWYLQEEMWLLRGLLEAVRDVNDKAGADSIVKAPIKQIDFIQLQGGDMAALTALASGEASADGYGDGSGTDGSGMPGDGYGGMGGMMPPPGMSGYGEGAATGGVDFNLAEEVGPNTLAVAAEGDLGDESMSGDAASSAATMPGMTGIPGMSSMYGADGMASAPNPLLAEKRYVDDDATAPFKTRAFKMQVVMDHRQLPEFLAELTNSAFPVRILRVHWTEMNQDTRFAGTGTGAGGGYESSSPMGIGRGSAMPGGYSPPGLGSARGGMGSMGSRPMGSRPGMGASARGGMGSMPGGYRPPGLGSARGGMGSMPGGYRPPGMGSARGGLGSMPGGSRGMGPGGYRPPGMPGMSGEEGGFSGEAGTVDLYSQAMTNPYLAQVVVGGLMTIYRSPQEMAAAAAGEIPAEEGAEAVPAEGDAAAATPEGDAPVDGTTQPDAAPTDGTAPATDGTTPPADGTTPPADPASADGSTPADPAAPTPDAAAPPDASAPAAEPAPADSATPPAEESASPQP